MLHNALHVQSSNYNATTNIPALATTTGYNDNIFQVTTQGIQSINGVSSFCGVGDEIIVSNGASKFFTVTPVQYNAATGAVGALSVTIAQLQQVGRIITISVAGTQTINGVATNMAVGQAWEYNGVSWLNIISDQAKMVAVQTATSSDRMTRIIYPTDAYYSSIYSAGVQTGAICITLPVSIKAANTMLKMTVNVYDYTQPTTTSSICIAGYWQGALSNWNHVSATNTCSSINANYPVSFGINALGVPCIYIGSITTTWSSITRVSIDNLLASYAGATIANLSSGWNIGIVDSIVGTPIVLNSNFTQAKGLYDIDAAGNMLTQVNSTSARFTGPISTYPLSTYKVNSKLYNQLFITSQLSGDLSYQQLMFSPTTNSAGGIGFARMCKYDADGLNPSYKPLFGMNPDTGVVSFNYIPTAPTAALGDNTTQLATTAFVQANANPTSSYATQAEVNAGTVTNKAVAPSTLAQKLLSYVTATALNSGTLPASFSSLHANTGGITVTGTGDVTGYGFVATTPNGVYAPSGNSKLGALTMLQSSIANLGISYPNIPNATSYTMGFGWDGSHVRGLVDNNPAATFVLANLSDVTNAVVASKNAAGVYPTNIGNCNISGFTDYNGRTTTLTITTPVLNNGFNLTLSVSPANMALALGLAIPTHAAMLIQPGAISIRQSMGALSSADINWDTTNLDSNTWNIALSSNQYDSARNIAFTFTAMFSF